MGSEWFFEYRYAGIFDESTRAIVSVVLEAYYVPTAPLRGPIPGPPLIG
jgi:hypothetical protein